MENDLKKLKIGISQQPLIRSDPTLELGLMVKSQILWKIKLKTTSHGRLPQKLIVFVSQQPLVRFHPNLKHRLRGPSQMSFKLK
jgi:hypothetical protein